MDTDGQIAIYSLYKEIQKKKYELTTILQLTEFILTFYDRDPGKIVKNLVRSRLII